MNKLEFINDLGGRLSILPPGEVRRILDYYVESIDDRVEDGMDEAEAIASFGPLGELAARILSEQEPLEVPAGPGTDGELAPRTPRKRSFSPGVIVLLVLGSPIWLSLAVAAAAVVLVLYLVVWAVLASLTVVAGALILGGIASAAMAFFVSVSPDTTAMRVLLFGASLACTGAGFLLLPAMVWLVRAFARLHRRVYRSIRNRKEARS